MALALQTVGTIDFSACPVVSGLTPGKFYRLTGLTQGSLGTFDVIAVANTPTQLSESVSVFPTSVVGDDTGWPGIIDYTVCKLTYLQDNKNNQVGGVTNISVFPWFPAVASRVSGNVIDQASTVNLGSNLFAGVFLNNKVLTVNTIIVSGAAVAATLLDIRNNVWSSGVFNFSLAVTTRLLISGNTFSGTNTLADVGATPIGDVSIIDNTFSNSIISYGNGGTTVIANNITSGADIYTTPPEGFTHTVQDNIITHNGSIQIQSTPSTVYVASNWIGGLLNLVTVGGNITITANIFGPSSELNLTPDTAAPITFGSNTLYGRASIQCVSIAASVSLNFSTIMVSGQFGAAYDFNFKESGNSNGAHTIQFLNQLAGALVTFDVDAGTSDVDQVTVAAGGVITCPVGSNAPELINVYVENGTLDYNSQPATNIRLQGANSTLVAPVTDAKKDGYAGALP